jgi:hypothetical protein
MAEDLGEFAEQEPSRIFAVTAGSASSQLVIHPLMRTASENSDVIGASCHAATPEASG